MDKKEAKDRILNIFNTALSKRQNIDSSKLYLSILRSSVIVSMFDNRLEQGENTRKVMLCDPIQEDDFVKFSENTLKVNNLLITREYRYSCERIDSYLLQPLHVVIEEIRKDLPHLVDAFLEQVDRNNEYLNPTLEKLNVGTDVLNNK